MSKTEKQMKLDNSDNKHKVVYKKQKKTKDEPILNCEGLR